ncbi:N-acetyltransferase [Acidovorax sp. sic0104]|uniref:GNAT family N-acetyltransferase n=1 Tax=Acidovorax sp. sic0104 TaxID=2854784 RepID=UPI002104E926|nr:GNAT family N-acetyltransferase [Acidovorax sp. sic0104]
MLITLAGPPQHESLVDLLCELNAYYRLPGDPQPAATRDAVRAHLHGRLLAAGSPLYLAVAARADGTLAGLAAVVLLHSLVDPGADSGGQCLIKELFVSERARGEGVGRALMAWAARFALEHGCARMDWNVKASNQRGIAFYERLGAGLVADRLSYRLGHAGMQELGAAGQG